jgi:hypothetical protein
VVERHIYVSQRNTIMAIEQKNTTSSSIVAACIEMPPQE